MLTALALAVLFFPVASAAVQTVPPSAPALNAQAGQGGSEIFTLRVTTREVLLDVIALDAHDRPVLDLAPGDLQVTALPGAGAGESRKHHHETAADKAETEPIASLRVVDPNATEAASAEGEAGFRIAASCLERSTVHYRLAFRPGPEGSTSGYHDVVVKTARADVHLHYPHRYYIGVTEAPATPPVTKAGAIDKLLQQAACYYPETPPSIALRARMIATGSGDVLRYSVAVDAGSLSFLTLTDDGAAPGRTGADRRVQVDYGVCNFDVAGHPINFFHAPVDQVLSSADYARALAHGFPHLLEFPAPKYIGLTRFVVRDRATGNLGATDVQFPWPVLPSPAAPAIAISKRVLDQQTAGNLQTFYQLGSGVAGQTPEGPIGSFGSIVPAPHSFCGDVYELRTFSEKLPDFRELDPIGSVYTPSLDVPNQIFTNASGIPGVTPRTDLFGVDYHGAFWIRNGGDYVFRLMADDGAVVEIDDQQLINEDGIHAAVGREVSLHLDAGRHTVHVPYYQGSLTSVALELWVKGPGSDWRIFDLGDFARPPASAGKSED